LPTLNADVEGGDSSDDVDEPAAEGEVGTGEEDKDEDLYSDGDYEDSSDDDTAIPGTVATFIGNATAPAGYTQSLTFARRLRLTRT
jgi:hypothetical protein